MAGWESRGGLTSILKITVARSGRQPYIAVMALRRRVMKPKTIRLFIKPWCGWCQQAVQWLEARHIQYETLDVTADSAARAEMRELSGQTLAPVIEVDGEILADFDTGQLAKFWQRYE